MHIRGIWYLTDQNSLINPDPMVYLKTISNQIDFKNIVKLLSQKQFKSCEVTLIKLSVKGKFRFLKSDSLPL